MSRQLKAMARPDAYAQTAVDSRQMPASFAGMGLSAMKAYAANAPKGGMAAAANNVPAMALMFANPKGRAAQMRADKTFLGASKNNNISARYADSTAGGIRDIKMKTATSAAFARGVLKVSAGPLSLADEIAEEIAKATRKNAVTDAVRRAVPALPEFPTPVVPSVADATRDALAAAQRTHAIEAGVRAGMPRPPMDWMKMVKKMAPAALGLPLAVGGVAALDRGHRGLSRTMDGMAEEGRFNNAMGDFDPSSFGDPSFQYRYEESPDEMQGALREAFGVLNRVAPTVAKDPVIAREYMRRMVLDPELRQPPEEYLRQVTGAVQLENQMQNAQPSLFDGIGATVGGVMKGSSTAMRRYAERFYDAQGYFPGVPVDRAGRTALDVGEGVLTSRVLRDKNMGRVHKEMGDPLEIAFGPDNLRDARRAARRDVSLSGPPRPLRWLARRERQIG